jgi:predicted transcriptional regulator
MAKAKDQKAGSYAHQAHQGFSPAWNPNGLAPEAEKELAARGLIPKPAKTSARKRSATAAAKAPASTSARDLEAELPSRSKRKRQLKSRHFRLPAEIDEKLEYLADHYETTLVYIICKAVQEEWLRTMRQQRRDERAAADGTPAPETGDEP